MVVGEIKWSCSFAILQKYLALHSKICSKNIAGNHLYLLIENIAVIAELEESVFGKREKRITSQETPKLNKVFPLKKF